MKRIHMSCFVLIILCLFAATNASAEWYNCKITAIAPKPNGIVELKFIPGTGETRFTEQGRGKIIPEDAGAKNMLATVLTAISLNREMTISLVDVPSSFIQEVNGINLLAE